MAVSFTPTIVTNPFGVQGSYPLTHDVAHEGMLVALQAHDVRSMINQQAAVLPFGAMAMTDNTSGYDVDAVKLATGATLNVGVVLDSPTFEGVSSGNAAYIGASGAFPGTNIAADGRVGYPAKKTVNILRKGVIWVYTTEAIALGAPVRFWDTDYSATVAGAFVGRFCTTASSTRTTLVNTGMAFLSETSGAGLVQLEINFPSVTFTADT